MRPTWLEEAIQNKLATRAERGSLRVYPEYSTEAESSSIVRAASTAQVIDFSSNDYLGLARDPEQKQMVEARYQTLLHSQHHDPVLGATGSRLLSGDSTYVRQLEQRLADWHQRPAALIFNSGYDANLAVLSCIPCDFLLYDEYSHNSLRVGMRLSRKFRDREDELSSSFRHNSVQDLRKKIEQIIETNHDNKSLILVVVESVYSMDGDVAPLRDMLDLALEFGALVLVDEAHGLGIYGDDRGTNSRGTGVLAQWQLEAHPALACSIHTFGKAAGCHGSVICGTMALRQYLWNYGWPLVYSTSLPLHSLVAIECSYETMTSPKGKALRQHTQHLINLFRNLLHRRINSNNQDHQSASKIYLLPSTSPIQALVIPINGNQTCTDLCKRVWAISEQRLLLYPIKSPTVPKGLERIRIILHGHNTLAEVKMLVDYITQCLVELKLFDPRRVSHSRL